MTAAEVFDVVVVGAGLMGSSAAYFASKAGKRVLLLDQFALPHANGSSHGRSRIFRVAYPNGVYTKLCLESLALWQEIEKEAGGVTLIEMTGELDFAQQRNADLAQLEATLTQHDVAFETLTGAQVNARFPGFSLDESDYAVFNSHAGVLNPDLAMATLQSLAKKQGALIRDNSKVSGIFASEDAEQDLAVIELADSTSISARQCIVTSGAWTTSVLKSSAPASLQIQPIATYGTYWKCFNEELYQPNKFPVFINYEGDFVYGLPMMDTSGGVKICRHDGPNVDPDTRTGVEQPADQAAKLRAYVAKNFSQVDASAPSHTDHCIYSMTADENFIIDFLSVSSQKSATKTKNVVVGAGFSGHGAKMTPVIGKILAELALQGKTEYNVELFCANRSEVTAATEAVIVAVSTTQTFISTSHCVFCLSTLERTDEISFRPVLIRGRSFSISITGSHWYQTLILKFGTLNLNKVSFECSLSQQPQHAQPQAIQAVIILFRWRGRVMEVTIVNAATLVCLRQRPRASLLNGGSNSSGSTEMTWEVLLGQSEVKNWLRSTEKLTCIMRYPGEWKFPGGVVDDCDASLEATALRELREEFMGLPEDALRHAHVHFLGEKLTKPIQSRRHRMFNFIAFEDENAELMSDEALRKVNVTLQDKRKVFEREHLADGSFWRMESDEEKMRVSPEIVRVQWFPIDDAMQMMRSTLLAPYTPVDEWQRQEFDRYGVAKRDPMYITFRVLQDIAEVQPANALKAHLRFNEAPSIEESFIVCQQSRRAPFINQSIANQLEPREKQATMGQDKGGNLGGGKAKRKRHEKKKASTGVHASEQVRAVKSQTNALFNLATTSNPNPKHLGPFSDRQRILVIGDGDLSFSLSLAVFLGGRNIVATCYDSKREVKEKYTNALLNADALETAGAQVYFDVDGTALEKEAWILNAEKFQTIVFNFPHLGGATEDDVVKNQELLRNFFYSTRPFLHPTRGQVLVSLRNTLFYNRWKIQEQAKISGFKLVRAEPFDGGMYSGYEPQRTHPASFRGEPPSTTGAHYYIFAKDASLKPEDPRVASGADSDDEDAKPKRNTVAGGKDPKSKKAKADTPQKDSLDCKVCATKFRDLKKYNAHINSAKHARKMKAQKKR